MSSSDSGTASDVREAVGVIGLGLLGSALVERLREAGHEVLGHDIDGGRAAALGIESAASPLALAGRASWVILSLPDADIVNAVVEGDRGLLAGAAADRVTRCVIDTSTVAPEASVALGRSLEATGIRFVEAAVSGSSQNLRDGEAALLVGANVDDLAAARAVLEALADVVFHVGDVGAAARVKLATNLVLGLSRLALAEGLGFAERLGIHADVFLEALRAGPARSAVLEAKGRKMARRDLAPRARLAQHLKDVRLILELGAGVGARLPTSELHRSLLESCVERGLGELDNAAIAELFRE